MRRFRLDPEPPLNAPTKEGITIMARLRISVPTAVRYGAALLWSASAVWTTVSVHHIIGNWTTSGVVTALVESAYGLATVWFHSSRTKASTAALVAALVPVVAALAYADHDMFGWIGLAFAAGPLIAEGGFLLAAHLGTDPTAPTAEQRAELAALLRDTAHQAALRAAERADRVERASHRATDLETERATELETELAAIRADSVRQLTLDSTTAEVMIQRIELDRRLRLAAPLELDRVGQLASLTSNDVTEQVPSKPTELNRVETERVTELVSELTEQVPSRPSERVTELAERVTELVSELTEQVPSRPSERVTELAERASELNRADSFGFRPDRTELKRRRTESLAELLAAEPGASNSRISKVTGIPLGSVDRYRKSL